MRDSNWTYTASFRVPPELLAHTRHQLYFGSIDTAATITLNGVELGQVANAHRPHAFDVLELLVPGEQNLSVAIAPATAWSEQQAQAYPYSVPRTQQEGAYGAYNFIRKGGAYNSCYFMRTWQPENKPTFLGLRSAAAASDFGWDWGPSFAPAGIGGSLELRSYSTAFLNGLNVQQLHLDNGSVLVTVGAELELGAGSTQRGLLEATISGGGAQPWSAQQAVTLSPASTASDGSAADSASGGDCIAAPAGATPSSVLCSLVVQVDPPFQLWWPYEFGAQPLYTLNVSFSPDSKAPDVSSGSSISDGSSSSSDGSGGSNGSGGSSSLSRRIGLRTVELVTDPLPGGGESFYFRVNGLPVYARGANVVPPDILPTGPRSTDAALRQLVASATAANMNFLRVWGGGRYLADAFYDACDEAGVLVWQEAMFACALYPANRAFLEEVSRR